MKSYVWVTFALLGVAYYQLSGGDKFAPGPNGFTVFASVEALPEDRDNSVNRLSLLDLTDVAPPAGGAPEGEHGALDAAVLSALRSITTPPAAESDASRVALTLPVDQARAIQQDVEEAAQAEGQTATAAPQPAPRSVPDLRRVNGSFVNLRTGPGEDHPILTQLAGGTTVQILEDPGQGWVQLQVIPMGRIGWIADYLLTNG